MEIKRVADDAGISDFINEEFSDYATDCGVALNYEEFCYAAEEDGKILGVIIGRAYYNEVHIGYEKIALTTFGFQAPEFYKKLGYKLEFVREDKDPKLNKYFYLKNI